MRAYAGPAVTEFAPAKLNLALHVTGRRADGYHLLDSLVVFADMGDRVTVAPGQGFTLSGPFAGDLTEDGNLCLRAAVLMGLTASIGLEKVLPVASGIGGGSADAAAVLRAFARGGEVLPGSDALARLGADVPVCMLNRPARMRGVGEVLDPLPPLPGLHLVLVNPGVAVSTPAVFAALARRDNPGLPDLPVRFADADALADWLALTRNDLQEPALVLAPVIGAVLDALAQTGARLSRMSGSGATCFGLFPTRAAAQEAQARIKAAEPGWWVVATGLAPEGKDTGQ